MKKLAGRLFVLALPAAVWFAAVVVIDPFDYFNVFHSVPNEIKKHNARAINTLFYHAFQEANVPSSNVLIGDSRTADLPIEEIASITGQEYRLLTASALKINEITDLFWLAQKYRPLKNVYVGINFSMFNEYAYADRVTSVRAILANPLRYVFNPNTAQALFYVIESWAGGRDAVSSVPPMNRDEFWDYMVTVRGQEWYGKYKFPTKAYEDIRKMAVFCKVQGISLTFIIVPHHVEFQNRLWDYKLTTAKVKFLESMLAVGATVVDYDYVNAITLDKRHFVDPVHYNDAIGKVIVDEVWRHEYVVGRVLNRAYVDEVAARELGDRKPTALTAVVKVTE
jgi:hypothetical protein